MRIYGTSITCFECRKDSFNRGGSLDKAISHRFLTTYPRHSGERCISNSHTWIWVLLRLNERETWKYFGNEIRIELERRMFLFALQRIEKKTQDIYEPEKEEEKTTKHRTKCFPLLHTIAWLVTDKQTVSNDISATNRIHPHFVSSIQNILIIWNFSLAKMGEESAETDQKSFNIIKMPQMKWKFKHRTSASEKKEFDLRCSFSLHSLYVFFSLPALLPRLLYH